VDRFLEKNVIEIAPIAFMRGRTLNDSFIILDEAQNTTSEQMKMFVTRMGFSSKVVITGDITQVDLPDPRRSGLLEAIDVLSAVEGISFVYFDEHDVVRHQLVQHIVRAYDDFKSRVTEAQLELLDSKAAPSAPLARNGNGYGPGNHKATAAGTVLNGNGRAEGQAASAE
jgi:phosphate starvation-inducible PhoH-like protein